MYNLPPMFAHVTQPNRRHFHPSVRPLPIWFNQQQYSIPPMRMRLSVLISVLFMRWLLGMGFLASLLRELSNRVVLRYDTGYG